MLCDTGFLGFLPSLCENGALAEENTVFNGSFAKGTSQLHVMVATNCGTLAQKFLGGV